MWHQFEKCILWSLYMYVDTSRCPVSLVCLHLSASSRYGLHGWLHWKISLLLLATLYLFILIHCSLCMCFLWEQTTIWNQPCFSTQRSANDNRALSELPGLHVSVTPEGNWRMSKPFHFCLLFETWWSCQSFMWTFACAGFSSWNGEGGSAGRTSRSGSASGNATQLQWPQLSVLPSSHSGMSHVDQSTRVVRIECFLIGAGEQDRNCLQNLHFANNRLTAGQLFCMRCVGLAKNVSEM